MAIPPFWSPEATFSAPVGGMFDTAQKSPLEAILRPVR
jgi:hypothetical protein